MDGVEKVLARSVEDCASGCVIWTGAADSHGHGVVKDRGRAASPHRVIWEHARGEIPPGHDVHHECETKRCVNVDHLALLTHGEHSRVTRLRSHCHRGHPIVERPAKSGRVYRLCLVCERDRHRRAA